MRRPVPRRRTPPPPRPRQPRASTRRRSRARAARQRSRSGSRRDARTGLSPIGPAVDSASPVGGGTCASRLDRSGGVRRGGSSGRGPAGSSGTSCRGQSRFQFTPGGSPNPHRPMPTRVTPAASYRIAQPAHDARQARARAPRGRRPSVAMRERESKERRGRIVVLRDRGAVRVGHRQMAAERDAGIEVDARARAEVARDPGEQRVEAIRADARVARAVIVQPKARGSVRRRRRRNPSARPANTRAPGRRRPRDPRGTDSRRATARRSASAR